MALAVAASGLLLSVELSADTLTFSGNGYNLGQAIQGVDGWKFYPGAGYGNDFRVAGTASAPYLQCFTSGPTYMERPLDSLAGLAELRWQWRSPDTSSKLTVGIGNVGKDSWGNFRLRIWMDRAGTWAISGLTGIDNSNWPKRVANQWYYMRLQVDLDQGLYSVYMDTSPDRNTELTLVTNAPMTPGAIKGLLLKAMNGGDKVDLDNFTWGKVSPSTWDGGGADNKWSTPANWTADRLPGETEIVYFNNNSSKDVVLDKAIKVRGLIMSAGYKGTLSLGDFDLEITGQADFSSTGAFSAGSGRILLSGSNEQGLTPSTSELPPIEHTGSGAVTLATRTLKAKGFIQRAGTFQFGGQNMVLSGDLQVLNGKSGTLVGLGGRTVTVGGNASLSATSGGQLGLAPETAWTLAVTGTLTAKNVSLKNSKATASPGQAENSLNGGGNTGWSFIYTNGPLIVTQPQDVAVSDGDAASFSVSAQGADPLTYQWQKDGTDIAGATSSNYSIPSAAPALSGSVYRVVVTDPNGNATSRGATLLVSTLPVIDVQPADAQAVEGFAASFSVSARSVTAMTYQWYRNGNPIAGATGSLLELANLQLADKGTLIHAALTNADGIVETRKAKLDVLTCLEGFAVTPGDTVVNEGDSLVITGHAACATRSNWVVIDGPVDLVSNPEETSLSLEMPRVEADTVFVLKFSARYSSWKEKVLKITVRNALPDPVFTLFAPSTPWKGMNALEIKPLISNLQDLESAGKGGLNYTWEFSGLDVSRTVTDTSVMLLSAGAKGSVSIKLCLDNGGKPSCATSLVEVDPDLVSLENPEARLTRMEGNVLILGKAARVELRDIGGRLLWHHQGTEGERLLLPEAVGEAMRRRTAVLRVGE